MNYRTDENQKIFNTYPSSKQDDLNVVMHNEVMAVTVDLLKAQNKTNELLQKLLDSAVQPTVAVVKPAVAETKPTVHIKHDVKKTK